MTIPRPGWACPDCGNLCGCTCQIERDHRPECRYRKAAMLSVELACDHGFQACPECDPCCCDLGEVLEGVR